MSAMGKIQTKGGSTCFDQLADHVRAAGRRTNGGYYFCATKCFSNGHGYSANGGSQTYQNVITKTKILGLLIPCEPDFGIFSDYTVKKHQNQFSQASLRLAFRKPILTKGIAV